MNEVGRRKREREQNQERQQQMQQKHTHTQTETIQSTLLNTHTVSKLKFRREQVNHNVNCTELCVYVLTETVLLPLKSGVNRLLGQQSL